MVLGTFVASPSMALGTFVAGGRSDRANRWAYHSAQLFSLLQSRCLSPTREPRKIEQTLLPYRRLLVGSLIREVLSEKLLHHNGADATL